MDEVNEAVAESSIDSEATNIEVIETPGLDKIKKWDHIAVRPDTFLEFRRLRSIASNRSDDAFVKRLLERYDRAYRLSLIKNGEAA